jgi:murein DD-endopeptidase MepM/ murein hydrolase activator NlpD
VAGDVSSGFGWRQSPYGGGSQRHTGLDIRAEYGTPVRVSAPGTVVFAGRDSGGYGTAVVVDHGNNVKTLYGHLSGLYVSEGQRIARGTVVGAVGNSGRATGVHLHYEVRVGNVPVDPMLYVRGGSVQQVAAR